MKYNYPVRIGRCVDIMGMCILKYKLLLPSKKTSELIKLCKFTNTFVCISGLIY
jgi:hypothetical protein